MKAQLFFKISLACIALGFVCGCSTLPSTTYEYDFEQLKLAKEAKERNDWPEFMKRMANVRVPDEPHMTMEKAKALYLNSILVGAGIGTGVGALTYELLGKEKKDRLKYLAGGAAVGAAGGVLVARWKVFTAAEQDKVRLDEELRLAKNDLQQIKNFNIQLEQQIAKVMGRKDQLEKMVASANDVLNMLKKDIDQQQLALNNAKLQTSERQVGLESSIASLRVEKERLTASIDKMNKAITA